MVKLLLSSIMSSRLIAGNEEVDLDNDSPLIGLADVPLQTLEETLNSPVLALLEIKANDFKVILASAKRKIKKLKKAKQLSPLSEEEAKAINLYTQETNLYRKLNELLRARSRRELKPLFPYLKLLLTALYKLPPIKTTVYRGVPANLAEFYPEGRDFVWWGFTSTSANIKHIQSFLGTTGKRALFAIAVNEALDIQRYSAIGAEEERLVLPGTCFEVKGVLEFEQGDMIMIQIGQDSDEENLIAGFAFQDEPDDGMSLALSSIYIYLNTFVRVI